MRTPAYKLRRRALAIVILASAFTLLLGPVAFVALSSFDYGERAYVVFPPEHVTLAAYWHIPERYWQALALSTEIAAVCALASCLIGIPAALGTVRSAIPWKAGVLAVLRAPLQIPAVVAGVAFLQLYYYLGALTGWYGVNSFVGLVVAHTFAATPYVVATLVGILQRFDASLEEAALSLGATTIGTLRQVTLPLLKPGIFAGALYAFMVSFGEVPMSVFLTGSRVTTFPVEVFNAMQFDFEPTILAVSTLVIVVSIVVVSAVQRLTGLDVFVRTGSVE
jgi:putative spermidine/putrescine transport system permease protein